jgi:broad specificity phosphatase PhoE
MEETDKYCTFYIVRHGESEHNVNEIMQGHSDSPLTPKGREQAKGRARDFKDIIIDKVFASDLIRAQRTAEIIGIEKSLEVNTTKILRERFFGSYEGHPISEFTEKTKHLLEKLKILSEAEKQDFKYEQDSGYESNNEIAERMLTFLRETAVVYPGKTILVVSHGSIMRALLMRLGVATYDQLVPKDIEHLAYIKLKTDGVDFFVEDLQDINTTKFNFKKQLI